MCDCRAPDVLSLVQWRHPSYTNYHGLRNHYLNNLQGNIARNCICNLAAQIILEAWCFCTMGNRGTSLNNFVCNCTCNLARTIIRKMFVFLYAMFRKILVSVKFVSAILRLEMAAPILWTPGKNASVLQEKAMSIKFLVLGGGVFWVWGGGGVPILFLWARGFFWNVFADYSVRDLKILVMMSCVAGRSILSKEVWVCNHVVPNSIHSDLPSVGYQPTVMNLAGSFGRSGLTRPCSVGLNLLP